MKKTKLLLPLVLLSAVFLQGCGMMNQKEKGAEDVVIAKKKNQSKIDTIGKSGKENPTLEDEKAKEEYELLVDMIYSFKYEEITRYLDKLSEDYSFNDGEALKLAALYKDASAMSTVYSSLGVSEAVERMSSFEDPMMLAFAPLRVFNVITEGLALNGTSLDPSGEWVVEFLEDSFMEKGTPEIAKISEIKRYVSTKDESLLGVYRYKMKVDNIPISAYVSSHKSGQNKLIGYYADDEDNPGYFKTVSFFREQANALSNAANSNWNEDWDSDK